MKSEKPEVSRKHLATVFFKGDKQIPLRENILVNLSYCNGLMGEKGGEKKEKKSGRSMAVGSGKHVWAPGLERTPGEGSERISEHRNGEGTRNPSCIRG